MMALKDSPKNIEKQVHDDGRLCFSWKESLVRIFSCHSQLELNSTEITLRRSYYGIQRSWKIPLSEISPSHVIWYFQQGSAVLGINDKKKTCIISSRLKRHEIEWLAEEIKLFLARFQSQALENVSSKPTGEPKFEKQIINKQHVRFFIPDDFKIFQKIAIIIGLSSASLSFIATMLLRFMPDIGSFIFLVAIVFLITSMLAAGISLLQKYSRQILDITPTTMKLSRENFGGSSTLALEICLACFA